MSKARARQRKKQERLSILQKKSIQKKRPNFFGISNSLISLLVVLITLYGGYDFYRQAVIQPEILATEAADPTLPLAVPFAVKNNSTIFSMHNTIFHCGIDNLEMTRSRGIKSVDLVDPPAETIESGKTESFRCMIGTRNTNIFVIEPNDIIKAHLYLWVSYDTLFFSRNSEKTEFTWFTDAKPFRWIKDKIAD